MSKHTHRLEPYLDGFRCLTCGEEWVSPPICRPSLDFGEWVAVMGYTTNGPNRIVGYAPFDPENPCMKYHA